MYSRLNLHRFCLFGGYTQYYSGATSSFAGPLLHGGTMHARIQSGSLACKAYIQSIEQ